MTGASYRNLLKWKDLPIAEAYVEEKVKEALAGTYNKLISAGPAVADRLLSIALNPETKSYAAVSACEAVIRSIERGCWTARCGNTSPSCESRWPSWSMDDRSMFEPRLLTEEEAQWRASCGWHVDRSAVSGRIRAALLGHKLVGQQASLPSFVDGDLNEVPSGF